MSKSEQKYFASPAIGSSILGTVIAGTEPLQLCLDLATVPIKPTGFMEVGKMFEDFVEEEFSGKSVFSDKYFHSSIKSFPETSRKDLKDIFEILDGDNIAEDIKNGYVLKDDGEWNGTYANRNECLKEIAAHDYRRPIPDPIWKKLMIMLERFKACPFEVGGIARSLSDWMTRWMDVEFQVEYFWKHESGAECRAKFDMIWKWNLENDRYAIPFDLKVTANWLSFTKNWKYRYVWQSKHYVEGFARYCAEKNMISHPVMWYLIQESGDPQIAHVQALSVGALGDLTRGYDDAIPQIWKWVEADKPIAGFTEQQIVDRWGKPAE
jgi:hypothetical protein